MGSNPNWVQGQEPTPAEWNAEFAGKADDVVFAGDQGAGGTPGQVPPPPPGSASLGYVLGAGGGWVPPNTPGGGINWIYQTFIPLSGDTVTMSPGVVVGVMYPATEIATLIVNLPASPSNGQIVEICAQRAIDLITVNAPGEGGGVLNGGPLVLPAGHGIGFIFDALSSVWFRRF